MSASLTPMSYRLLTLLDTARRRDTRHDACAAMQPVTSSDASPDDLLAQRWVEGALCWRDPHVRKPGRAA